MKNTPWKIGHRINLVIGANGGSIAHCIFSHSNAKTRINPTAEECAANAQLISAAPDLLIALQRIVGNQQDNEARYGHGLVTIDDLKNARYVIAKATFSQKEKDDWDAEIEARIDANHL